MRQQPAWWGLFVALITASGGCPNPGKDIGESCAGPDQCRSDLQCLSSVCTPLCKHHVDCGDGYLCEPNGRCQVVEANIGDDCHREIDCGPGQACVLDDDDPNGDDVLAATCQQEQPGAITGEACSDDHECRNENCVLGRCTQLCTANDDCPKPLACTTIPRPIGDSAPHFKGCLPTSGVLRTTLPMATAQETLLVPVPSNAMSFAVTATINDDRQFVGASEVVSPSNKVLYTTPFEPLDYYKNLLRHRHTRSISTLVVPDTPAISLEVGAYQMTLGSFFEAGGNGTAIPQVTVDYKLGAATTLDLHFVFLVLEDHPCAAEIGETLDASSAQNPSSGFQTGYLDELRRIFTAAGLTIGEVTYTDIDDKPEFDGLAISDLPSLLELTDDPSGITIYMVRSITPAGIEAMAGGNPGPPRMAGTAASGIVVSTDTLCYRDWAALARSTAHELCRYLGLFRNREPDGNGDPIVDSDSSTENLMYFGDNSTGTHLSPGQQAVLALHPLLR